MKIRIPFLSRKEDSESLRRCIDFACNNVGIDDRTMIMALTYFFEQVACEMAQGNTVNIPGFGLFGHLKKRRRIKYNWGAEPDYAYPAFNGSAALRQEVRFGAPPNPETIAKMAYYMKNATKSVKPGKPNRSRESERVFSVMDRFRQEIEQDLAGA